MFWLAVIALGLARLPILGRGDLAPDEAYYWIWSRYPAWGYYDQGPMVAWWIWLTVKIFGTNEMGVRMAPALASLLTTIGVALLADRIYGRWAALWAVLFLNVTPLMFIGGSVATYDPMLICFWVWTLVLLERALSDGSWAFWLGAGIAAGLGLLSKHTMVMVIPGLWLALFLTPQWRPWLRKPQPYFFVFVMGLLYVPNLLWNAHHNWMTIRHLLFLSQAGGPHSALKDFGAYIGSQVMLVSPILFVILAIALVRPNRWDRAPVKLMWWSAVPILLFFALFAFKTKVQANWAINAYPSAAVLAGGWLADGNARRRWTAGLGAALAILMSAVVLFPAILMAMGVRAPALWHLTNQTYGWKKLGNRIEMERRRLGPGPVFICGNDYQYCSEAAFYTAGRPKTYDLFAGSRLCEYVMWNRDLKGMLGENALYINNNPDLTEIRPLFRYVDPHPLVVRVWRKPYYRNPVRINYIFRCYGYRKFVGISEAQGG